MKQYKNKTIYYCIYTQVNVLCLKCIYYIHIGIIGIKITEKALTG